MTWRTAPNMALVLDPAGQLWELSSRATDRAGRPYVELTDPESGHAIALYPNPDDAVSVLIGDRPGPIGALSLYFQLERIG